MWKKKHFTQVDQEPIEMAGKKCSISGHLEKPALLSEVHFCAATLI